MRMSREILMLRYHILKWLMDKGYKIKKDIWEDKYTNYIELVNDIWGTEITIELDRGNWRITIEGDEN